MIDETQADFVRELFEMYATGKFSMKQMEKHFYQKGIRNSKGKMLSHSTMSNIIRNPKYKGYYAGNKVRITDLFTKKQKFLPEEEWVMYKDETGETVPAIVSEELWDKANEVLYMRSQDVITAQHKTVHQNLLTGKLICAHCGMPYYRKDAVSKGGEKISKWVCSGKIKNGASSCPSRAIYESEIKPIIEDIFKSGQQHIEELSACVLKLVSEVLDTNENKDELNRLNQELITRQKMKAKLLQYNADGRMNDSEFIRMTADCDNEIKDIEKKINALKKTSKTEREMKKELAEIKTILKAAEKHIDGEEIDRAFIDRYISDITVYPDEEITRFEIHLKAGTTVTKTLQNLTSRAGSNSKIMITTCAAIRLLLRSKIIKIFCTQKVAPPLSFCALSKANQPAQLILLLIGRELIILCSALPIKAASNGNRLQQGRLAAAVFAYKKCNWLMKLQFVQPVQSRNILQITVLLYIGPIKHNIAYK